jgi:hypothetical protein
MVACKSSRILPGLNLDVQDIRPDRLGHIQCESGSIRVRFIGGIGDRLVEKALNPVPEKPCLQRKFRLGNALKPSRRRSHGIHSPDAHPKGVE